MLGIVAMRRGEIENCLECSGPSSCIFPIVATGPSSRTRPARARRSSGSREFLEESPRDLRIIWLLNIAYMTLGEHPEKVPPQYLIPNEVFRSKADSVGSRMSRRGRGWVCAARIWPAAVSSTILTETTGPTCSRRRSMPSWARHF